MGKERWWEFYFVRYAMGTLVGAVIVAQMIRVDPALSQALMWGAAGIVGSCKLVLLASYGLTFCYISSIPILVLHAARSLLPIDAPGHRLARLVTKATPFFIPVVIWIVFSLVLSVPLVILKSPNIDSTVGRIAVWAVYLCIFSCAILMTLAVMLWRRGYYFYKSLAKARAKRSDEGELVTSYRHLREHGNSIFIILLECMLGLGIFGAFEISKSAPRDHLLLPVQFYFYGVLGFFWVAPGALVWLFATLIENEFVRDRHEP